MWTVKGRSVRKASGPGLHRTLETLRDLEIQPWGSMAHKWHLKWVVCSRKKNTEGEESSGQDLRGHQNQRGAQCETRQRGLRTNTQSSENREEIRGENSLEGYTWLQTEEEGSI